MEAVAITNESGADNPVGRAVRRMRTARGLTQQQVADRSGLGFQHISMLERGDRPNPTYDTMCQVAEGLGVDVLELLAEAEGELPPPLQAFLRADTAPRDVTAEEISKLRLAKVVLGKGNPDPWDYAGMLQWLRSRR